MKNRKVVIFLALGAAAVACMCTLCCGWFIVTPASPSYYATRTARSVEWATESARPTDTSTLAGTPDSSHTPIAADTPRPTETPRPADTPTMVPSPPPTLAPAHTPTVRPTATTLPTATPIVLEFWGWEPAVTTLFHLEAGRAEFTWSHDARTECCSMFFVKLLDREGQYSDLIANEIGQVSGSTTVSIRDGGRYKLFIEDADGYWTVTVRQ